MKVKVAQSCLTLCDLSLWLDNPWNSPRILEQVAFPFSRGSSQPRDRTQVSCIAGGFLTSWATREAQEYWSGSVSQSSHSVVSDSLWPHEVHTRPPCPSPTPGVHSNSCPSSRWCHPAISSSVVPFSSCPLPPSIRVFSNESTLCMRWPKCWSFSFSIIPSKEIPGLIYIYQHDSVCQLCHNKNWKNKALG